MDNTWWESAPLADDQQPETPTAPAAAQVENWWESAPLADQPAQQAQPTAPAPTATDLPKSLDPREDPTIAKWDVFDGQEYARAKNGSIYKVDRDESGGLLDMIAIDDPDISKRLGGRGGSRQGRINASLNEPVAPTIAEQIGDFGKQRPERNRWRV